MTLHNKNHHHPAKNHSNDSSILRKIRSDFKTFSPSKTFIGLSAFFLGVSLTLIANNSALKHQNHFSFANNHFAMAHEIDAMEKRMNETLENHQKRMREVFSEAQKKGGKTSVSSTEDNDSFIYELNFSGFTKEEINVSMKDNVLTFFADKEKDKNDKVAVASSFSYSFLIPPQYDKKIEPEITRQDDKIVVKLVKKKS